MKRLIPWISGVIIIAGCIWSFLYLKDWHPFGSAEARLGNGRQELFIVFKGAKLVGRSNGKKVWAFDTRTIEMSQDHQFATFSGVTKGVLMKDGKPLASLAAGKVVYNTISRNVLVPGGADFMLKGGPSFKVRDILWDGSKSVLHCKGGVDGTLGGSTFHAARMTADIAKKEFRVEKVSGQIKIGDTDLPPEMQGQEGI